MTIFKRYIPLVVLLCATTACQHTPIDGPESVDFDIRPAVQTGGIFMRENTMNQYQAPPKQIDTVRAELALLNEQLGAVRTDVVGIKNDPLEARMRQVLAETQSQTEARLAAKDQVVASLTSKFQELDQRLAVKEKERAALLSELNSKFEQLSQERQAVEEKLTTIAQDDLAGRLQLQREKATLENQIRSIQSQSEDQKYALATLRKNIETQRQVDSLKAKAVAEGRELRLMEELKLRQMLEENRRENILSESRRAQEKEKQALAQRRVDEEKREILKTRIASLQQKLSLMEEQEVQREKEAEERRTKMEERLQNSLKEMQVEYDAKVQDLKDKNEKDVIEKLASLEEKHKQELAKAEEYRHAIEERIFAMESQGISLPTERMDDTSNFEESEIQVAKLAKVQSLPSVDDPNIMIDEPGVGVVGSGNPADWVALGTYEVVVHEENQTLRKIVQNVVRQAEPFVGPWRIKWRLKKENMDVLSEKFSLDAETDFDAFANYISNFMRSHRGFLLTFNIFESERVLVITDEVSQ